MAELNYPTRITILGALIGLLGAVLWPSSFGCVLLLVSLALDALDGKLAREFDCCTELGAKLDWWSDVTIGNALALAFLARGWATFGGAAIVLLVFCQGMTAWARHLPAWFLDVEIRTSGRAAVTLLALIGAIYGGR